MDRLRRIPLGYWVAAASVSGTVAFAAKAGNVAMFVLHPARHWPLLESIEALDAAATIPVAVLLLLVARPSRLIGSLTAAAIAGMVVITALSIAWAAEWLTFGKELVPMILFGLAWIALFCWLVGASWLAWRSGTLPGTLTGLAIATVLTGTFLYPVWAIWLALNLVQRPQIVGAFSAT